MGQDKRRKTRNDRTCHRSAVIGFVGVSETELGMFGVVVDGTEDADTGGHDIHEVAGRAVVVGEVGLPIVPVSSADADDIVVGEHDAVVADGRQPGAGVVGEAVIFVAGGGHYRHAQCHGIYEQFRERVTPAAAETEADHVGTVVHGILDAGDDPAIEARALVVEHLQGHDAAVPVMTGDALGVIGRGADDTGAMRAVTDAPVIYTSRIGTRIVVPIDEIPAVDIVHKAVAVVVLEVIGYFVGVAPDAALEVGMVQIHAAVNDGDDDCGTSGLHVPGLFRLDERPVILLGVASIVGDASGILETVR